MPNSIRTGHFHFDNAISNTRYRCVSCVKFLFRAHKKPPSDWGFCVFVCLKPSSTLGEITTCNQIVTTLSVKNGTHRSNRKGKRAIHSKLTVFIFVNEMILYAGSSVQEQASSTFA